jgi:hypothetical protein
MSSTPTTSRDVIIEHGFEGFIRLGGIVLGRWIVSIRVHLWLKYLRIKRSNCLQYSIAAEPLQARDIRDEPRSRPRLVQRPCPTRSNDPSPNGLTP